ncbi:MAG: hypothetical protein ACLPX9_20835 [Rhodomicrobium sp.]
MVLRALAIVIAITACPAAFAQQGQCDPAAFREAVASASATITLLHEKNGKAFQENLQKLRALNNWQEAEYLANAAPFVKDETTASLDAANQALLTKVQSLDAATANTEPGRCAMLNELKSTMEKVVANTTAKWEHMLDKLNRASAQPIQAGFTR